MNKINFNKIFKKKMNSFFLLLVLFTIKVVNSQIETTYEKNLTNLIIKDYDKTIRPLDKVEINIKISLKQIVDLNERDQIITTSSYLFAEWIDSRLAWNSTYWNNTYWISMPSKRIWLPDFFIINTADSNGFVSWTDSSLAYIHNDGLVYLAMSLIGLKTRCSINIYKVSILIEKKDSFHRENKYINSFLSLEQ